MRLFPKIRMTGIIAATLALLTAPFLFSCGSGGSVGGQNPGPVIVSLSSSGVQANERSEECIPNRNGSVIAFGSWAGNLSPLDNTLDYEKIFIRNRSAGNTVLVSIGVGNDPADGNSYQPSADDTGNLVVFTSEASNLVPGDTNGYSDIFVRDMAAGTTTRVSFADGGAEADGASRDPSICGDGSRITFRSDATNLVPISPNPGISDIYLRETLTATTSRISVASDNSLSNGASGFPVISRNGRFVVFHSEANNLVPGDTNNAPDIFIRDLVGGTTDRVSIKSGSAEIAGGSYPFPGFPPASISADGRFVAFMSEDGSIVPNDNNGTVDVFVRDRTGGTTEIVSISSSGYTGNGISEYPSITDDGRYVVFRSYATNLSPGIANPHGDLFVHDRTMGTTRRIGLTFGGGVADNCPGKGRISGDGSIAVFPSPATNLVPADTNTTTDIFIRPL